MGVKREMGSGIRGRRSRGHGGERRKGGSANNVDVEAGRVIVVMACPGLELDVIFLLVRA